MTDSGSPDDPLDVLIVGAGISGIGLGCTLSRELPDKRWRILEARADLGGTWDLFRYPGVRSDSDLYTFGYEFRPWTAPRSIASAADIKAYLRETASELGVTDKIAFGHRVLSAAWSDDDALWTVTAKRDDGETVRLHSRWLFGATGYYSYERGYRPRFPDEERFRGPIVHPQHWPEDLAYDGARVVVIGSGATAVTLVPALGERAAHVTQIQRTPTYVLPLPSEDRVARLLFRLLPDKLAFALARGKNLLRQRLLWLLSRNRPALTRRLIRRVNAKLLPDDFDVETHFTPPYEPWDQRLCIAADGDFFRVLSSGEASLVTGNIARFTETGVEMESGQEIPADVIVTATGLNLELFGGAELRVNDDAVRAPERLVYKGMMLDGVPNFAFAVGYTTSSWTLKIGLVCDHFCRLLSLMDERGWSVVHAERPADVVETRPLLDFDAGYVKRSLAELPRQGDRFPWEMTFHYAEDARMMRRGPVLDPALRFRARETQGDAVRRGEP